MRASVHVVYRNTENITVSLISLEPYKDRNLSHYLTRTKKALLTMNAAGLFFIGASEGIRTPDRLITNQLLYQLSYTSEEVLIIHNFFSLQSPYFIFFALLRTYSYWGLFHGAYYQSLCTWF